MKDNNSFVQFIADQMQEAGSISFKSMFGGYTFYCGGKIVALVCGDELFVKQTVTGRKFIGTVNEASPYPGAKPCFLIQDRIDNKEWISELIRLTAAELPFPKRKKPTGKKQSKQKSHQ